MSNKLSKSEIVQLKYFTLKQQCEKIEAENETTAEKVYQIGKAISRLQKQRLQLLKRLQNHGDEFRSSKRKFVVEDKNEIFGKISPTSTSNKPN